MDDEKEPTQTTEQGYEIPVPKREDFDRLLRKAAHPKPDTDDEVGQAALRDAEYPSDGTDEG